MNVLTIIEAVARFFASHPVIFGVTTAWGLVLAIKSALKARSTVDRVGNYLGVALQAAFLVLLVTGSTEGYVRLFTWVVLIWGASYVCYGIAVLCNLEAYRQERRTRKLRKALAALR